MGSYSKLKSAEEHKMERESLAQDEAEDGPFLVTTTRSSQMSSLGTWSARCQRYWTIIVIHLGLLAVNVLIVSIYAEKVSLIPSLKIDPIMSNNPIKDKITYEEHRFELLAIYNLDGSINEDKPSHFLGTPRPELEAAWDHLMNHSEVRVSNDELGGFKDDDSIVKLTDGSGYYVTISAFHGLHCLRRVHKYLWSEHYYPDLSEHDSFFLKRHTEHCLDWIRQYIQCHADPTLIPIHWTTNDDVPVAKDYGKRMCVSWESFEEWMAEHSFDPLEPGLLVHPLFGIPEGVKNPGSKVATGIHDLGKGSLFHADGHVDQNFNDN
ncbi:hypothetical protein F5Y14DRAFT_354980 [Nemania sp. NC0429]|nr:hypothetical protein F5Y14DRAFT_354980 [Nemania sp. NC0429]